MLVRTLCCAATAAALLAAPRIATADDLTLRLTRTPGTDTVVRGAVRVDAETLDAGTFAYSGDVAFSVQAGSAVLPTRCRPSARLDMPPAGEASLVVRSSARLEAAALEQIAASRRLVLHGTLGDGTAFEPLVVAVPVVDPEQDLVRAPLSLEVVTAEGEVVPVAGDVLVVRNTRGHGRVVVRTAAGGPLHLPLELGVSVYDERGVDEGAEAVPLVPRSARLRFQVDAPELNGSLGALTLAGDDAEAAVVFPDRDGDDAPDLVATGVPTTVDRSARAAVREVRRDATQARLVTVVSDPAQVPASVELHIDGEGGEPVTLASEGGGGDDDFLHGSTVYIRTLVRSSDASLASDDGTERVPTGTCALVGMGELLAENACELPLTNGGRCETPSGATCRVSASAGRMRVAWTGGVQYPFTLDQSQHPQVSNADGQVILGGETTRRTLRTTFALNGLPSFDPTDGEERGYRIVTYNEDGVPMSETTGSFVPAEGALPLVPEPLRPHGG